MAKTTVFVSGPAGPAGLRSRKDITSDRDKALELRGLKIHLLNDYPKQMKRLEKQMKANEDLAATSSSHAAGSLRLKNTLSLGPKLRTIKLLFDKLPAECEELGRKLEALDQELTNADEFERKHAKAASQKTTSVSKASTPAAAPPSLSGSSRAGFAAAQPTGLLRIFSNGQTKPTIRREARPASAKKGHRTLQAAGRFMLPPKQKKGDVAAAGPAKKRKAEDDEGEEELAPARPRKLLRKAAPLFSDDDSDGVPEPPTPVPTSSAVARASASRKRKAVEEPAEAEQEVGRASKKAKNADTSGVMFSPSPPPGYSENKLNDDLFSGASLSHEPTPSGAAHTAEPSSSDAAKESGSSTPLSGFSNTKERTGRKLKSGVIGRNKIDLNSKSVACAVKKKTTTKSGGSKAVGKPYRVIKNSARINLNGIVNHKLSCFASVIIHLIDTALEDCKVDEVLGEVDEDLETFGLSAKDVKAFDNTLDRLEGKKRTKQDAVKTAFKATIKAASKAGETEKVSAAKHLRSVIDDLRTERHGDADRHVSAYVFESVLAFGRAEDADLAVDEQSGNHYLNGDEQQDTFDHYTAVLNAIGEDPHAADGETFKALFEQQTEMRDVCKHGGCGYESDVGTATDYHHDINLPAKPAGEKVNFGELFMKSKNSLKEDEVCPQCGNQTLEATTTFAMVPDNMVFKLNRTAYNKATKKSSKIDTFVDLQPRSFKLHGEKFELAAAIRHSGAGIERGHYTIFRKFGADWYLLEDKECHWKAPQDVKDHGRDGKSAMLLFKKMKA